MDHITWVLMSQPLGSMVPGLPSPLCRADCPTKSPDLLSQLKCTFLCVPARVPGPGVPHSTLRASTSLWLREFKPGTIHCKPTPSLNRNREVFKTINKPLPLAEDQILTFLRRESKFVEVVTQPLAADTLSSLSRGIIKPNCLLPHS